MKKFFEKIAVALVTTITFGMRFVLLPSLLVSNIFFVYAIVKRNKHVMVIGTYFALPGWILIACMLSCYVLLLFVWLCRYIYRRYLPIKQHD